MKLPDGLDVSNGYRDREKLKEKLRGKEKTFNKRTFSSKAYSDGEDVVNSGYWFYDFSDIDFFEDLANEKHFEIGISMYAGQVFTNVRRK